MNSFKNCSDAPLRSIGSGLVMPFIIPCLFLILIALPGCGPSQERMEKMEAVAAMADSIPAYLPGIVTDTIHGTTHNFIRTANLKCKVADVMTATRRIEDLLSAYGGYVIKSDLSSTISANQSVQFKKDSTLELTYYNTGALMQLHVPAGYLDTLLRRVTDMSIFVDYRRLAANDIKMRLVENKMAENRYKKHGQKLERNISTAKASLKQAKETEAAAMEAQAMADQEGMELYQLADQVNYSTVALELYQAPCIQQHVSPAKLELRAYTPSFMNKLGLAFLNGFEVLKSCALFLINSWGLLAILAALFFSIRKFIQYYKNREVLLK